MAGGRIRPPPAHDSPPYPPLRRPEAPRGRAAKRNRTLGTEDPDGTPAREETTRRYQELDRRGAVGPLASAVVEAHACAASSAACSVHAALPCGPTEPSPSKSPAASPHIAPAKDPRTDRLTPADRLLWVWLARSWREWRQGLIPVKPETVVHWSRQWLIGS